MGGKFYFAGGVPANHIAKWDGKEWTALGSSEGYVYDLGTDSKGNLYASGIYPSDPEKQSSGIAQWKGQEWISVPSPDQYSSAITTFKIFNDMLYVSGTFEHETGVQPHASFARWDGKDWQVYPGLGQTYNDFFLGGAVGIEWVNGKIYLAGDMTKAGDLFVKNVVEWDEQHSQWRPLDDKSDHKGVLDGSVTVFEESVNGLYAGGSFHVIGNIFARNIAKWNGNGWESLGTEYNNGVRGAIYTMLADGDDLYVGGYFGSAGTVEAYHVAKWDGSTWSSIGIGVGGIQGAHVNALARIGDYLYVGGYFAMVGDEENYALPANSIARYNLTTQRWETLGSGLQYINGFPGVVYDLEIYKEHLIVGGRFYFANEEFFENIAALTDNKWSGIEKIKEIGIEGDIRVVKVVNENLYIGGSFQLQKGGDVHALAKWDGGKWKEAAPNLSWEQGSAFVLDIEPFEKGFVAGGRFSASEDVMLDNIGYFDGSAWNNLGGGIFPGISDLVIHGHSLFFAGYELMQSGNVISTGMARFDYLASSVKGGNRIISEFSLDQNYPNPFNPVTTIAYTVPSGSWVTVKVYDTLGREMAVLANEYKNPGTHQLTFDGSKFASGIYFYRMQAGPFQATKRLLLLK